MKITAYESEGIELNNEDISLFIAGSALILRKGLNTRKVLNDLRLAYIKGVISAIETMTTAKSIQFHASRR